MNVAKTFHFLLVILILAQSLNAQHQENLLHLDFNSLDSMLNTNLEQNKYALCLAIAQTAALKAKQQFGEVDSIYFKYTLEEAKCHTELTQYSKSESILKQLIPSMKEGLGERHKDYLIALFDLTILYFKMGNSLKALSLSKRVISLRKTQLELNNLTYATQLNDFATYYHKAGKYEETIPLYLQAKAIYKNILGEESAYYAISINNLASVYENLNDYQKALPLYIQANRVLKKTHGTADQNYMISLSNIGLLYQKMGQYKESLATFKEAKTYVEKALGKAHPRYAALLSNTANLYVNQGKNLEALPLLKNSKDIIASTLGKNHPYYAYILHNLANAQHRIKNYDEALNLYKESASLIEQKYGASHPKYISILINFVACYREDRQYKKAWFYLQKGFKSYLNKPLSTNITEAWADSIIQFSTKSNAYRSGLIEMINGTFKLLEKDPNIIKKRKKKLILSKVANDLLNYSSDNIGSERDKLLVLEKSTEWLQKSLLILDSAKDAITAFEYSDQNKSVLLMQATQAKQNYVIGDLPDSLVLKDRKLLKLKSELEAKLLEQRTDVEKIELRKKLNDLNQDIDNFGAFLKNKYPKYYQLKYKRSRTKVDQIQKLLDDHTCLIQYVLTDSFVHIFRIDHKDTRWIKKSLSLKTLNAKIQLFRKTLSNYKSLIQERKESYNDYSEQAYWFYQTLLNPVLEDQKLIKNIIIISDGQLGHIPFEAFLVEPAPPGKNDFKDLHYVVQDYNISYNFSATYWKESKLKPTNQNNGQMLALAANYEIMLDSQATDTRLITELDLRQTLKKLPEVNREVDRLKNNFQGLFLYDKLAAEKAVKQKALDYAVLHFATHGILDKNRPLFSALALTEDSDRIENNFLHAYEISKMELNADLVVLSACETGYGRFENGNGIASLARAFSYAGASSLIASLWQVNDYTTPIIMNFLYHQLSKGISKDEALRMAKIKYIEESTGFASHPAFWSSFIIIGNTSPIQLQKKGHTMAWGIGIGILALLGIGGFIFVVRQQQQ